MSKHPWKWKLAVVVLLTLLAVAWAIQRSRAGGRLQPYLAELRAQGEKLTFAELGVTGTTNGAVGTKAFLDTVAEIETNAPWPKTITSAARAEVDWTNQQPRLALSPPATPSWAGLEQQVDAASAGVAKLRELLKDPARDSGWNPSQSVFRSTDDLNPKRAMGIWLYGAMMAELHRDRIDAACGDVHLMVQVTHLHRDEPFILTEIIRGVIGSLAMDGVWQILQKPDLTEEALAGLNADITSLEFVSSLDKMLQCERACYILMMDDARRADAASSGPRWSALWYNSELDEAFYLENLQTALTAVRSLQGGESWRSTQATFVSQNAELDRIGGSLIRFRYPMTLIVIPSLTTPIAAVVRFEARKRLALAAIALRRHELRHHEFPADLAALVPEFLPEVPRDIYDGKPLRYRLNKDGSFLLYSVGENLNDDGGSPVLDIIWQDVRPSLTK